MEQLSGIYRITNLKNNKSYIGQSRNIYIRWKQHTQGLKNADPSDESLIRKAFIKYGQFKQISSPGDYNNFRFEIIEECLPDILLEREQFYIQLEMPEYNLFTMPPNPDYKFKRKDEKRMRFWMQYHNIDKEQHYPGQLYNEEEKDTPIVETRHYISTKKRDVIKILDDIVLMITGLKIGKTKKYFAWSVMIAEELDFLKDEKLSYNVIGDQKFFLNPVPLNDIEGFKDFFHRQGHPIWQDSCRLK